MKSQLRVLVADDDEGVLSSLSDLIGEDPGFTLVGAASTVDEAVEIARLEQPHVALIDVRMPDGGGEVLAAVLSLISPRTKIVAHSALDDESSVRSMVEAGVDAYLAKGRAATNVLETIRGVARGEGLFQMPAGLMRDLAAPPAEPAPGQLEASFATLFESSPAAIILVGSNEKILRVNPAFCAMLGYEQDELVGGSFEPLMHPDELELNRQAHRDLLEDESGRIRIERRYVTKAGGVIWVDVAATLVRDPSGEPLYTQAVSIDITERKRAEAALHESEQSFRALIEGLPGYVYRAQLNKVGAPTYISPQVLELFGFSPEQFTGNYDFWSNFIHPDDREAVISDYLLSATAGTPFEREYRVVDAAGQTHWIRDHAVTVHDQDGIPLYSQGVALDITDSVDATAEREANRAKSQFLASMSHEIRTPLNSILGFAQLLSSGDFGSLNDRQARYVANIRGAGDHLLELVNDVLDLSKVQAGQLEFATDPVAVSTAVADAIERMRPAAEDRGVTLAGEVPARGLVVVADARRLNQVLLNLLSNAVKFTPAQGSVTVSARAVDDDAIEISVADTGVGIPAEDLDRIFQEFTQVRRTAGPAEGTGLGLAVSRSLVEGMGGGISVASTPDEGSTFTVRLPVARRAGA